MHELAAGYRRAGHEVVLVVAGPADEVEDTAYGRLVRVAAPEIRLLGGYRVITDPERVTRLLDDEAPDRLEVSDRFTLRSLGWWAQAAGVPSVIWSHEHLAGLLRRFVPPVVPRQWIADLLNRCSAAAYNTVVCTTDFAASEFRRIGATNLVKVPLGVDLEVFRPGLRSTALHDEMAHGADVLVVHCGRLSREKEPGRVIHMLRDLVAAGLSVRLAVLGDGPVRASLIRAARGLPVDFHGFVDDRDRLATILASADVVVAPGPLETFGLAGLEALASGTPVVVSASGALSEIVVDRAGLAVADTPAAFAAGVLELLALPEEERRRSARRRAETFPWSTTVRRMLALHSGAIAAEPAA